MEKNCLSIDYVKKLVEVEARSKSNTHRIDKLEELTNTIQSLAITMNNTVNEIKFMRADVTSLDDRLGKIENEPINKFNKYKDVIITSILTSLVGLLVGLVLGG